MKFLRLLEKQHLEQERFNRTKEQTRSEAVRRGDRATRCAGASRSVSRSSTRRERQDSAGEGRERTGHRNPVQSARRAKAARDAADAAGDEADNLERAARASGKGHEGGPVVGAVGRRPKLFNRQRADLRRPVPRSARVSAAPEKARAWTTREGPMLPDGFEYKTKGRASKRRPRDRMARRSSASSATSTVAGSERRPGKPIEVRQREDRKEVLRRQRPEGRPPRSSRQGTQRCRRERGARSLTRRTKNGGGHQLPR